MTVFDSTCHVLGNAAVHHWLTAGKFWILPLLKFFKGLPEAICGLRKNACRVFWLSSNQSFVQKILLPKGDFIFFPSGDATMPIWVPWFYLDQFSVGVYSILFILNAGIMQLYPKINLRARLGFLVSSRLPHAESYSVSRIKFGHSTFAGYSKGCIKLLGILWSVMDNW